MVQGKGIRHVPLLDPTAVIPEISRGGVLLGRGPFLFRISEMRIA